MLAPSAGEGASILSVPNALRHFSIQEVNRRAADPLSTATNRVNRRAADPVSTAPSRVNRPKADPMSTAPS
jgi:hypothetical protein